MPSRKRGNRSAPGTPTRQNTPASVPATPVRPASSSSSSGASAVTRIPDNRKTKEQIFVDLVWDTGWFWVTYALDVVKHAVVLAKKPLSVVLILYLSYVVLLRSLESAVPMVFTPICQMPLMTRLIPICNDILAAEKPKPQPDFPSLMNVQSKFENILDATAGSTTVALELKKSEMAIRDLTNLVRISDLVSKDKLSILLDSFIGSAKTAGRELQRLGSRVGGTVDNILAMDDYVLRLLEQSSQTPEIGPIASVMYAIVPFGPSGSQQALAQRKEIESLWFQATGALENNIARLIAEAEASVVLLDRLEEDLDVINGMIARESQNMRAKTDELLAELWTKLGGNRRQLANFKSHRALLANIRVYRNRALGYVTSTLVQLQQLSSDLEDLRDRVATPLLSDPTSNIPLEVHIGSIRKGIDRLTEGRSKAKAREDAYLKQLLDGAELLTLGEDV